MAPENPSQFCLSCGKTDSDTPLLVLQFAGKAAHICPQCLPILIHHPDRLMEKLLALMAR